MRVRRRGRTDHPGYTLPIMLRARLGELLPAPLRRLLRPVVAPLLYRLERPRTTRLYATLIGPGDTAFDVGAAEGYHSDVLRRLGARVVAVEPRSEAATVLRRRFARTPSVSIVEAAASAAPGTAALHACPDDPELATIDLAGRLRGRYRGRRWRPAVAVPVTTLAALAAEYGRPRFVKIDVEGVEKEVLAGLDRLPETLSFEFLAEELDAVRACVARLAELGPVRFDLSLYRRFRFHCGRWLQGDELVDVLCSLPENACGDVYARRRRPD